MDLPRLLALQAYWADHPPLHLMVKAYLGIKPKEKEEPGRLEELLAMIPMRS